MDGINRYPYNKYITRKNAKIKIMEIQFILTSINLAIFLTYLFIYFFAKIEYIYATRTLKEIRAEVNDGKVGVFLLWDDGIKTKIKLQEIKNYKVGETYTSSIIRKLSLKNPFKK